MAGRNRDLSAAGRRLEGGLEHGDDSETVAKVGVDGLADVDSGDEVGDGVHKRVLVADRVPRRPPTTGIGMAGLGDEDRAEAAGMLGIVSRVKFQLVHSLEVEG